MAELTSRKRELGRGERVLPGVFRLRLPLPWPGRPALQRLGRRGRRRGRAVRHRHAPARLAGPPGAGARDVQPAPGERAPAGLHPRPLRSLRSGGPDRRARRLRAVDASRTTSTCSAGRRTPAPRSPAGSRSRARAACPRSRCVATRPSGAPRNRASRRSSSPTGRCWTGVIVDTDLGPWTVHETPGHAPSHVCLFQPERRLLISGDHLLGRISLHFDYGFSADPVGEFVHSLDVVEDAQRAPVPAPATGARSPTCTPTSKATASSSAERLRKHARRDRPGRGADGVRDRAARV